MNQEIEDELIEALESAAETLRQMYFEDESFRDYFPWIGESLKRADDVLNKIKDPPSPCVNVCKLENDICIGCGRTKGNITHWTQYNPRQKLLAIEASRKRLSNETLRPPETNN